MNPRDAVRGRVFFLTGCASGIGRHLAGELSRRGGQVFATDVNLAGLEAAARADAWPGDRVVLRGLDVRDAAAWEAVFGEATAHFGLVDVLMNVAGVVRGVQVRASSAADACLHIEVNLMGVIHGCRVAARHMAQRGSGHILNVASLAGLAPVPGLSLYCASKFGVRGFSHALAAELAPSGVEVTVVCPDAVATPMLDAEALEADAAMAFSGGRILTAAEVTRAILDRALVKRPREMILPPGMAPLTRLVTAFPAASRLLLGLFQEKGRKAQAAYRKRINGGQP